MIRQQSTVLSLGHFEGRLVVIRQLAIKLKIRGILSFVEEHEEPNMPVLSTPPFLKLEILLLTLVSAESVNMME